MHAMLCCQLYAYSWQHSWQLTFCCADGQRQLAYAEDVVVASHAAAIRGSRSTAGFDRLMIAGCHASGDGFHN
jgi:hypothetical protein